MKRAIATLGGIAAVSLLALGGCGKKGGSGDEAASVAIVKPADSAAAPMTPPPRKAGLWEQKVATAGVSQAMKMCLDEGVEQKMKWWGSQAQGGKSDCEQQTITPHAGGGWDFHAVCKMGESGTVTSDGQATGAERAVEALQAVGAGAVLAIVRADEGLERAQAFLDALGQVDALAVEGAGASAEPAAVLQLGLPVARLDGIPIDRYTWSAVLCAQLGAAR